MKQKKMTRKTTRNMEWGCGVSDVPFPKRFNGTALNWDVPPEITWKWCHSLHTYATDIQIDNHARPQWFFQAQSGWLSAHNNCCTPLGKLVPCIYLVYNGKLRKLKQYGRETLLKVHLDEAFYIVPWVLLAKIDTHMKNNCALFLWYKQLIELKHEAVFA